MDQLERVVLKRKLLDDYRPIVGEAVIEEIRTVVSELKGARLLHLNSTATGGGVAELLNSLVPLESNCGLNVEWRLLCKGDGDGFFQVTKKIHNALQGQSITLSREEQETYQRQNEQCAKFLDADYDAIIVHDPQPAAVLHYCQDRRAQWAWRCHIDTAQPQAEVWNFLQPFVQEFDAAIFTMDEFVPPHFAGPRLVFIPPAIDPLSSKNRALPKYLCREEVAEFGIDLAKPLIIQVARFDPWKDPQGVIETYRLLKKELPQLQLALIGAMAEDDPQGWEIYKTIRAEADNDPGIFTFTNLTGVHAHEVNAFQRAADVVLQKSLREGFGLVVTEALWKGTPVVAGNTGGIRLQMQNGIGGFLVDSIQDAADRTLYLLTHLEESETIARRGWERVRDRFLMPRLLLDELKLVKSLLDHDKPAKAKKK